jgi:hypothetical protein
VDHQKAPYGALNAQDDARRRDGLQFNLIRRKGAAAPRGVRTHAMRKRDGFPVTAVKILARFSRRCRSRPADALFHKAHMTTRIFVMCFPLYLILMGGCASTPPRSDDIPPPEITEAVFRVGSLDTCFISGAYFKLKSNNKMDVIASLNGRNWSPSLKILSASPTSFSAILPYGPDYPQVFVRVYGMNDTYSEPFLVHVARRAVAPR